MYDDYVYINCHDTKVTIVNFGQLNDIVDALTFNEYIMYLF